MSDELFNKYLIAFIQQDYKTTKQIKIDIGVDFWNMLFCYLKREDQCFDMKYIKQEFLYENHYENISPR